MSENLPRDVDDSLLGTQEVSLQRVCGVHQGGGTLLARTLEAITPAQTVRHLAAHQVQFAEVFCEFQSQGVDRKHLGPLAC